MNTPSLCHPPLAASIHTSINNTACSAAASSATSSPSSSMSFSSTSPLPGLLRLPSNVLLHSILPFLSLRLKMLDLTRLSHSFPPLTPACFRHDNFDIDIGKLRRSNPQWAASLCLVSSVSSLWAESSWDDRKTRSETEAAELMSFDLGCLSMFRCLRTLRLSCWDNPFQFDRSTYVHRLLTSSSHQFTHLQSLCLRVPRSSHLPFSLDNAQALCRFPSLTRLTLHGYYIDPLSCHLQICALQSLSLLDLRQCVLYEGESSQAEFTAALATALHRTSEAESGSDVPASATPSLRTLLLPSDAHSRIPIRYLRLDECLSMTLPSLEYFDTGVVNCSAALATTHSSSLTALHVNNPFFAAALLHGLHTDGMPHLPQLRHITFSTKTHDPRNYDSVMYPAFLRSYCSQLRSLNLHLSTLGDHDNDALEAVFSCGQLRSLSLTTERLVMDTETGADGVTVFRSRPSPMSHLHTARLILTPGDQQASNSDNDTVKAILGVCPSLHHIHLQHFTLRTERLMAMAGEHCPHLATLWMEACVDLNTRDTDSISVSPLTRPLFPSLEAVTVMPKLKRVREKHFVRSLSALLSSECAPALQHLYCRLNRDQPLDTSLLSLLRPFAGLQTLGGVDERPTSWVPYRYRQPVPSQCDISEAKRVRMQRQFTKHVRSDEEMSVADVVRKMRDLHTTPPLHFVNAQARDAFFDCLPAESSSRRPVSTQQLLTIAGEKWSRWQRLGREKIGRLRATSR